MLAKKFALGFGIAVLFPLSVHYGVKMFDPEPNWREMMKESETQSLTYLTASPEAQAKIQEQRSKLADTKTEYDMRFYRRLFFVATPLGVLAVILGTLIRVQAVGSGLMFGGIFCVADGYVLYWSEVPEWMKFFSLLLVFAIFLFIGFKRIGEEEK